MVDATYIDNNRLQVIKADDIAFDTARPSITLFPDAYRIVKSGFSISFPSLIQSRAYYYFDGGGASQCALWSTLIWQEWGPNEANYNEQYFPGNPGNSLPGPTTRNLARTYLGSVPAAANYLDVRVRLSRTTVPANIANREPPIVFFPEGQWINLPGGSCPCEYFDPLIRHFDIVRIGNDIYLERFQSVRNSGASYQTSPSGGGQASVTSNESGWNSSGQRGTVYSDGTSGEVLAPMSNTELAVLISDKRGYPSQKRPGAPDACTGGFPDLTSTYTGDIIITPGTRK